MFTQEETCTFSRTKIRILFSLTSFQSRKLKPFPPPEPRARSDEPCIRKGTNYHNCFTPLLLPIVLTPINPGWRVRLFLLRSIEGWIEERVAFMVSLKLVSILRDWIPRKRNRKLKENRGRRAEASCIARHVSCAVVGAAIVNRLFPDAASKQQWLNIRAG